MTRSSIPLLLLPLLACSAAAQVRTTDSSITYALHWSDIGGNTNGLLEPGESALLSIDAAFTNQNGLATFSPQLGTYGSGTIRGLAWGQFDLAGIGGAEGQWVVAQAAGYGVDPLWDLTGGSGNGEPINNGSALSLIQFGQFATTPQAILATNPILNVWRGVWTPVSYSPRQVGFNTGAFFGTDEQAGMVWLELSPTVVASAQISWPGLVNFGSVVIPIVPAPATSLLALPIAIALGARRRAQTRL